jgi:hypothetical protein
MKKSFESGLSFGTTSGIVTTLGLIVGLSLGTHSTLAVVGGILSIAIADGLSESMSMHVSKKNRNQKSILFVGINVLHLDFKIYCDNVVCHTRAISQP